MQQYYDGFPNTVYLAIMVRIDTLRGHQKLVEWTCINPVNLVNPV